MATAAIFRNINNSDRFYLIGKYDTDSKKLMYGIYVNFGGQVVATGLAREATLPDKEAVVQFINDRLEKTDVYQDADVLRPERLDFNGEKETLWFLRGTNGKDGLAIGEYKGTMIGALPKDGKFYSFKDGAVAKNMVEVQPLPKDEVDKRCR